MPVLRTRAPNVGGAIALDAVLTLAFVLTGRGSHAESFDLFGILDTWWPFLIGLAVGWMFTLAWRTPHGILWQGVGIWVSTVLVGMLLRALAGQGTAWAFVIVATVALGVLLIGWRLIAWYLTRRRAPRKTR